ncbi:calmodulin-binding protein 25-like [Panicum miliaceum]|uniref:Calmodulin-binding protein 25-like n=1 Tax=Panicum miliaceum TaxID=4540 RepID=A0A3L6TAL2_PANMI|nr:calmodulin-binding protein 25-like [Panicum miliaceum]
MDAVSCLAPPAALLAASFADAAIARALHFSMSSDSASSSSSLSAPAPYRRSPPLAAAHPAAYAPHLTTCDSVPPGGRRNHPQQQLAPAGGRAGKRRSRASKRAPTTYISTDPANFRIMVQQITGVQQTTGGAYGNQVLRSVAPGGDEAASAALHQQFQQQPCFPTLDSWNVMYERSDLL